MWKRKRTRTNLENWKYSLLSKEKRIISDTVHEGGVDILYM
jgi:hypothetical protein